MAAMQAIHRHKKTELGQLPKEWEVVRLGDVVDVYDHKRVPLSEMERVNRKGIYPYCGANGVIDYLDDYIFDGEYILLAEDGGYYGRFEPSAYIMSGKFWVNNHAHILKAKEELAYNQFILYALNFLDISPYVVGSTRKKLNQNHMVSIKIPLPPLPEQRRIARVLGTVDSAIEKTDAMISHTERLKRGLMQKLLTRGIGHEEFKDTEIGRIPAEWEVVRLGDVAKLKSGGTPNRNKPEYWKAGTVPWVKSGELNDGVIYDTEEKITKVGLKDSSAKIFPEGTLVIALYGRGTVSKTAILGIDAATNQAVAAIIPRNSRFYSKFMHYYLIHSRSKLLNQSVNPSSDVGRTNIYLSSLKFFKLPLPPLPEQEKIAEILGTVDKKLELLRARRERLERVKRGLMNDLLTGRKRVPAGVV